MLRALALCCTLASAVATFELGFWLDLCDTSSLGSSSMIADGTCHYDPEADASFIATCLPNGAVESAILWSGINDCSGIGLDMGTQAPDLYTSPPNTCIPVQGFAYKYSCVADLLPTGACCGTDFCLNGVNETSCTSNSGTWNATLTCGSCSPGTPELVGNGGSYIFETGLSNAPTTLGAGERIEIKSSSAQVPDLPAGAASIVFELNHLDVNGDEISGYTNLGEWFDVAITSDPAFTGAENLAVFRYDGAAWVLSSDDCTHNPPALAADAVAPAFADGAWSFKICHTSTFGLGGASDGDDQKDKPTKGKKLKTPTKPTKVKAAKTGPKGAKDVKDAKDAKDAKKGKKATVIGGVVGGGVAAVGLAGAGAYLRRRKQNNNKKNGTSKPVQAPEQAVVVSI